jgi:hypothetical protein
VPILSQPPVCGAAAGALLQLLRPPRLLLFLLPLLLLCLVKSASDHHQVAETTAYGQFCAAPGMSRHEMGILCRAGLADC